MDFFWFCVTCADFLRFEDRSNRSVGWIILGLQANRAAVLCYELTSIAVKLRPFFRSHTEV
jgi:hypothetical protein